MITIFDARKEELPWQLLLEADPEKEVIDTYIYTSHIFLYKINHQIVGVLVLKEISTFWEIMNISVDTQHQKKGIGGQLIDAAIEFIQSHHKEAEVRIRTGETSTGALHLYKMKGFKVIERVPDYFVVNYAQPIYENGKRLRDQLVLSRNLTTEVN